MMDTVIARVLKTDNQGRATVIAVDDKAYIAAWKINNDIASEREACANVAEEYGAAELEKASFNPWNLGGIQEAAHRRIAANSIASLIRGREK